MLLNVPTGQGVGSVVPVLQSIRKAHNPTKQFVSYLGGKGTLGGTVLAGRCLK